MTQTPHSPPEGAEKGAYVAGSACPCLTKTSRIEGRQGQARNGPSLAVLALLARFPLRSNLAPLRPLF